MAEPTGPQLAGAIGAELAAPVTQMAQALEMLRASLDPGGHHALALLEGAIGQAHEIALRSQQVARLAAGRLRQSHEKLALHTILHEVLLERRAPFAARGIGLTQQLRPVEIIVDPGLLVSLLHAAIDWAAEQGPMLRVKLGMKNVPANGLLMVRASPAAQAADEARGPRDPDTLLWFLLQHTALAMGVRVSREFDGVHVTASLEFPRTVRNLSGLTSLDADSALHATGRNFGDTVGAGKHLKDSAILLITDDARLQREVVRVCQRLNLRMDAASSIQEAARFCGHSMPHLLVIDEDLHDTEFDRLRADLVRRDPSIAVIEVATASEGLPCAPRNDGSASRIDRSAIAQRLPSALALELNKTA